MVEHKPWTQTEEKSMFRETKCLKLTYESNQSWMRGGVKGRAIESRALNVIYMIEAPGTRISLSRSQFP
jgi:hypothetical protein